LDYKNLSLSLILVFLILNLPSPLAAAQSVPNQPQIANAAVHPEPASVQPQAAPAFLLRRVQFLSADSITHFRYVDVAPGHVSARDLYYKFSTRVQINLAADGSTYLQARGESGRSFSASYDYTGIGKHDGYWSFNLKSLYLGQKIGKHLEAQAGGIEFDRGAGTEATYADNEGWLEGYRLIYTQQHKNLPDKLTATMGYVGDFAQPNVFSRFHRMGEENYVQIGAQKRLGKDRDLSAEFDSIQSIRYTREAFR
jgi:hypothetical protein